MRTTLLPISLALALLPAAAGAQVRASAGIQIDLPVILPPLVVISPGVQVVQDFDREVFFSDGFYWVRHDGGWYRSRSHRGGWVLVPVRGVPARLVSLPPGHYKRWKPAKFESRHEDRRDHGRYDDRRGDRYEDRGHDRGDDHGRGHDGDRGGHGKKDKHGKR